MDPQVVLPVSVALSLLSLASQVFTHFTKPKNGEPKSKNGEHSNGTKRQVDINTGNITRIDIDMRNALLKLGVIEEQVKSNMLEILNIRPRLHVLTNELTAIRGDVTRLLKDEEERKRKGKP